jgi:DNA-binding NarL/FixJ family response regulator
MPAKEQRILLMTNSASTVEALQKAIGRSRRLLVARTFNDTNFLLRKWRPNAVLLDLDLPSVDLLRLTEQLLNPRAGLRLAWCSSRMYGRIQSLAKRFNISILLTTSSVQKLERSLAALCAPAIQSLDTTRKTRPLSKRQTEIVIAIANGLTRKQIVTELKMSRGTVNTHCREIFARLDAKNMADITRYAVQRGLV